MKEKDILKRLVKNDALFRNIHVITQNYDIIPKDKNHMGAYIEFQDLNELREDFLEELIDSIVDWIYSSDKFAELKQKAMDSIMSSLSLQWATGKALCEILNNSRYEGDDGADNIDSTIELLQNTISYNLPLLLKPLYDMKQSESPFLKCMQVGAFGVVERCMIEMGVAIHMTLC